MSVRDLPHYTLPATALADWIESQPEPWWIVDGDPRLNSKLDIPCPGDEIAPALRKIGKDLLLFDRTPGSTARGEPIDPARLNELADTRNWRRRRTFLFSWADFDNDWELREYKEQDDADSPGVP